MDTMQSVSTSTARTSTSVASEVEEWRTIPGFEGCYEASNLGRIKSLPRTTTRGGILRPSLAHYGYQSYRLSVRGHKATYRGHVLVMLAFAGPCPEGMEVCHINGDPGDNRLGNLRYDTHKENMRDIKRHGRHNNAHKTHCKWGHEFTPENTRIKPTQYGTARCCIACVTRRNKENWQKARAS